jgi:hypothetical protein
LGDADKKHALGNFRVTHANPPSLPVASSLRTLDNGFARTGEPPPVSPATMLRKILSVTVLLSLLLSPASGFDTFWHQEAVRRVAETLAFSEDARKIMQLGNFSPDFFGPVSEFAGNNLQGKALQSLDQFGAANALSRQAATFLHFDNLYGELVGNSKFDFLFARLLNNTQSSLAAYRKQPGADDRTRKVLILITLGASLHAVQDFYSHSDWVHQDFSHTPAGLVQLPSADMRAPTWFEFRDKAGDPDKWPFQVKTGIYPPVAGALNTHTHMNHDNSRLIYKEYENPGQPLKSEAQYHQAGNVPAKADDPAAVAAHQQFAYNTAVAASLEWVRKIEENTDAKAAIDFARTWNLKTDKPKLVKELDAGLATQLALSCAAGKWDGEEPPGDRGVLCRTVLDQNINPGTAKSAANLESILIGLGTRAVFPWALKYTGKFWEVHGQYHILQSLAAGIATETGHYGQLKQPF